MTVVNSVGEDILSKTLEEIRARKKEIELRVSADQAEWEILANDEQRYSSALNALRGTRDPVVPPAAQEPAADRSQAPAQENNFSIGELLLTVTSKEEGLSPGQAAVAVQAIDSTKKYGSIVSTIARMVKAGELKKKGKLVFKK